MKMRTAVVAFPVFEGAVLDEIQAFRSKHDPQFALLAPHFTLVFPVEAVVADVVAEAAAVAEAVRRFSFTLTSARAVRDSFGSGGHVFLIPDDGAASVRELHARLYSGVLRESLREDIPYVPHITVAADESFERCEALASALDVAGGPKIGRVDVLTVMGLPGDGIEELARHSLAG
jgi:2'-5' RNA ligase